ncbi:hypothetical protein GQ457_01G022150 [Hibiscus cannabinus]
MTGFRINMGEILAKELAAACASDKGILAFPCLISALCRRAAVPTSHGDKLLAEKTGWTRATYMRKMDVADATPLNVAMPTPLASPIHTAAETTDEAGPSAPAAQAEPQYTPAASSPVKFLCFQFPSAAAFFAQPSSAPPQPNLYAAAQPSTTTSAKAGATEEVHFSSDDENDVFDWQSPRDHLQPIGPTPSKPAMAVPILSAALTPATSAIAERPTPVSPARRKGKATAGRSFGRTIPSSPEEEEPEQRPAKRQRRYHVITADSDDDSSAELLVWDLNNVIFLIKRYCWKLFVLFRFYAKNDQPGRIKSRQYFEVEGGRNKVKVKDLKPKRIKDYLECKISQRKMREKPSFTNSRHVLNLPPGED